jgi:CheY-like chemotaxis protein
MEKPGFILLAEDSPYDVEMILDAFAQHNLTNDTVVVGDGEEALDFLFRRGRYVARAEGNPLLIVLDMKMPKVTGLDVLREIRADEKLRCTPVVMLTSSREEPDIRRSYQLGVNAYVVKPVDFQAFIEAAKQLGVFWALHNEQPPSKV